MQEAHRRMAGAAENPADILDAAERLGRLHELGRAVRAKVAAGAPEAPEGAKLSTPFANTPSPIVTSTTSPSLSVTQRWSLAGTSIHAASLVSSHLPES